MLAAEETARKHGNQVVAAAMLGHKADVGLMVLGPDLWSCGPFQTEIQAAGLEPVASYVSLTELSEYAAGIPDEMRQARLFPQLPPEGKPAFCFYPMSKRPVGRPQLVRARLRGAQGADARPRGGRPHVPRAGSSS